MSDHDFTTCDCPDCVAALLSLQAELDELERTDPDVRAAAESYDRMVKRITGRMTDPIGFAAAVYDVPREMVEGARDHLDGDR